MEIESPRHDIITIFESGNYIIAILQYIFWLFFFKCICLLVFAPFSPTKRHASAVVTHVTTQGDNLAPSSDLKRECMLSFKETKTWVWICNLYERSSSLDFRKNNSCFVQNQWHPDKNQEGHRRPRLQIMYWLGVVHKMVRMVLLYPVYSCFLVCSVEVRVHWGRAGVRAA